MAARGNLLRSLQDLDAAGSNERKMARLKRQQRHSAEILQTFLAYRLVDAAEKMELGIAIGDPLLLRHEPDNQWDPNAVKVFWQPSGCPGPICRQTEYGNPRSKAARCGVSGTSSACGCCSNRRLPCSRPVYRVTIAETSCAASNLPFSGDPKNFFG